MDSFDGWFIKLLFITNNTQTARNFLKTNNPNYFEQKLLIDKTVRIRYLNYNYR